MVTDDQASQTVWTQLETGALWGLTTGKIAIASSTLTVAWTRALAAQVAKRGATFLDAPVLGSRPQAEAGKLIYLVGVLAQLQLILSKLGGAIHHVGPIGQGMAMKLAVNTLFGIQVAALAEAVGSLQQKGIAIDTALDCLGTLPITSPAAKGAGALMAKNVHAPLFPIALVAKDFRYGIETAQAAGAQYPCGSSDRAGV
jgi:3-hydroxyisobutyrate dehydrogenase